MAKRQQRRRSNRAGGVEQALPALSSLTDLPTLDELRASDRQVAAFEQACQRLVAREGMGEDELAMGCVVRLDRSFPAVRWASGVVRAEFAAQLT